MILSRKPPTTRLLTTSRSGLVIFLRIRDLASIRRCARSPASIRSGPGRLAFLGLGNSLWGFIGSYLDPAGWPQLKHSGTKRALLPKVPELRRPCWAGGAAVLLQLDEPGPRGSPFWPTRWPDHCACALTGYVCIGYICCGGWYTCPSYWLSGVGSYLTGYLTGHLLTQRAITLSI